MNSAAVSLAPLHGGRNAPAQERRAARDPAVRDAVRKIMAAHSPLRKPLSAKKINAMLPPHQRRTDQGIRYLMRAIWDEAQPSN
jgi:hypothetical protein